MESDRRLAINHAAWDTSRRKFLDRMKHESQPVAPVDQWQKRYYRGIDMMDEPGAPDHAAKLRLAAFRRDQE
jgi:hypothetical protein